MSFTLRTSRTLLPRIISHTKPQTHQQIRHFTPTLTLRADLVQDLYLRELKSYKPQPVKANDHEGHVKPWSAPAVAKVPDLGESTAESELQSYKTMVVETESDSPDAGTQKKVEDWFDEEAAFAEDKPAEEHH